MNTEGLVKEFADCVAAQNEAMARHDPEAGNAQATRYIAAFNALRQQGESGLDALEVLLADGRAAVRVMAAAFLLKHSGSKARAVLEQEAKVEGLVAFDARQALKRWDDGSWSLDPR